MVQIEKCMVSKRIYTVNKMIYTVGEGDMYIQQKDGYRGMLFGQQEFRQK